MATVRVDDLMRRSPRALAEALKERAERAASTATPYRIAMEALTAYADAHSRSLRPEQRKKIALAKDELRALSNIHVAEKGTGAPGKRVNTKPKVQSRRNERLPKGERSDRGGSHRAK